MSVEGYVPEYGERVAHRWPILNGVGYFVRFNADGRAVITNYHPDDDYAEAYRLQTTWAARHIRRFEECET